jgi:hypothetical protein
VDAQMTYTFGESIQFSARLLPPQPATEALIFISTSDHPDVFTDEAQYDPARAFGMALTQLEQDWLAHGLGAATDQGAGPVEESPAAGSTLPFIILLALILIVPLAMAFGRRR